MAKQANGIITSKGWHRSAESVTFANEAGHAENADYAYAAGNAENAVNAGNAENADFATEAGGANKIFPVGSTSISVSTNTAFTVSSNTFLARHLHIIDITSRAIGFYGCTITAYVSGAKDSNEKLLVGSSKGTIEYGGEYYDVWINRGSATNTYKLNCRKQSDASFVTINDINLDVIKIALD